MATSLLDWIIDLMRDGSAREAFNSNPQMAMASAGFTNVCGSDVRPFIVDEPTIREVAGVDLPQGSGEPDIKYIVNNYTVESPSISGAETPGPNSDTTVTGDGNTVTTTQSDDDPSTDNSTDTASNAHNVVPGDGSAGDDQIQDSTFNDVGHGLIGDGNTSLLVLTDYLNDLHVLSDTVHDTLNGSSTLTDVIHDSPILNESPILDNSLNDSLDDLIHNLL
jgi:hypothetical protein